MDRKKLNNIQINKGVELMLRRENKNIEPDKKGLFFRKTFSLLSKKFEIKFEFTWER
jgi:hypothetical protein